MDAEQQNEIFAAIMGMSKISQNVMGGVSSICFDPANGIDYQGRRYNRDKALRLLENLISQAKLVHEMNAKAIEEVETWLGSISGDPVE